MKRIASVCMVAARQMVWKLLLILGSMVLLEMGLFYHGISTESMETFGYYLQQAKFSLILTTATVAVFIFQALQGEDGKGKLTYTLRRLPMGERAATTIWALFHMMTYWVLWAVQLAVILWCWKIYCSHWEPSAGTLELFTQFYRDDFLHSVLAMENTARAVTNGVKFLTLGFAAAYGGFQSRNRKKLFVPIVVLSVTVNMFPFDYRDDVVDGVLTTFYVILLGYMLWKIWWGEYEEA